MATPQQHLNLMPHPYRWTREEYYRLGELDFFDNKRVELIEGEVIEMSPIYSPHATTVTLVQEVMSQIFQKGWVIRIQQPLSLGTKSDPQPDIAVVIGKARDYKNSHPVTAVLVVEVADSSISFDRKAKASLYAKASLADYWIVNVQDEQVEVYRRPILDEKAAYGFSYAETLIFKKGDVLKPLAKAKISIAVADLLP